MDLWRIFRRLEFRFRMLKEKQKEYIEALIEQAKSDLHSFLRYDEMLAVCAPMNVKELSKYRDRIRFLKNMLADLDYNEYIAQR